MLKVPWAGSITGGIEPRAPTPVPSLDEPTPTARDYRDAVLRAMPDGLCVLDCEGRVTQANDAALLMLGFTREQLVGASLHDLVHPLSPGGEPRPAHRSPLLQALALGTELHADDEVFLRRDGTVLRVSFCSAPYVTATGRNGAVVVFNDGGPRAGRRERAEDHLAALACVGRIRQALDGGRVVLYAQPIVSVATGRTIQHELLVRILGADGEVVLPAAFLPVAERHGLIRAIDRRVIALAFAHASAGHPVHVNISADSIGDPELLHVMREHLERTGADPELLVLELTETALIEDERAAVAFANAVVGMGCTVALDDFGTGYSGFRYLKHLPAQVLKIDREFVRDLGGDADPTSTEVVKAIVSLARATGKTTIAEGVETPAVLEAIRELGVDCAQGWLFGRPAPADDVLPERRGARVASSASA